MADLQRLRADHAPALLAFERENRAYFAAHVGDRGDDYFADFDARHRALLAHQSAGTDHFHLLVEPARDPAPTPGALRVLGRVNLVDLTPEGSAELGYRIAEHATGRGLATAGVRAVVALATEQYGLTELRARTTPGNHASRAVLVRTGFTPTGTTTTRNQTPALTYTLPLRSPERSPNGPSTPVG